ncbi:N-acetylmuramoyl-L-alanine amidase [Sporosarcina sp. BI001-red]|uniref:N-acetylmuramoyl-L-alanine amidase family protein n=1 Tax=Sporosarcina sp. BI001-red TaxID=2282866 RepID=UPI000E2655DB|nr:N-acetylmuramoyl-L-alanine amidase [Sporosarcina sp. BI001-red]REB04813.1 N-acetylmuramoyl-L-alanine amidase [Sporosarcina sp. BI001-red]
MVKIVLDAGHGLRTPGKQTPNGEKEWMFNNAVLLAAQTKLKMYETVELLRVDDPTGKTDIPLKTRTDQANAWNADVYLSFHHNANTGVWGDWGGVETYTFEGNRSSSKADKLAQLIQPRLVRAMGLRDRGVRKKNLHVLRETKMPAILIEGGFMDSRTDIHALRNPHTLKAQGEAIADAIIDYYRLKKKSNTASPSNASMTFRLVTGTFLSKEDAVVAAERLRKQHGWTVYVKEES